MKASNGNKMNIVRVMALVLALVGVLTALPAQIAAMWRIINRGAGVTDGGLSGGTGAATLQFKYFANNLYVGPGGTTVYNYYEYDPTAADTNYYDPKATPLAEGVAEDTYTGTLTSYDVTNIGTPTFISATSSATGYICTCSHDKVDIWITSWGKDCSHESNSTTVSLNVTKASVSGYTCGSILMEGILFEGMSFSTGQVNADTTQTIQKTDASYVHYDTVTLDDDLHLIIKVTYKVNLKVTSTVVGTGKCDGYDRGSTACGNEEKSYTATATIDSVSATYTAYVRKTTSKYPAVTYEGLTQIKSDDSTNDGVLYEMKGLSTTGTVTMPDFGTLHSLIPVVEMDGDREKYENVLYPIGYYADVTLASGDSLGVRGEKISLPLTDLKEGITTVWIEWAVKTPESASKTDVNQSIESPGSVVLSGEILSGATNITNDFTYISDYYENSSGETSGALALTTPTIGCNLNLVMNYNGSAETNVNATDGASGSKDENVATDAAGKTVPVDDNVRDFTVVLQQNTTITGSMKIAGHTGSVSNSAEGAQGLIIGSYVALDLNGYTLTVANRGVLHSYGYIYDSVGTGKIVVQPGGTFYTQMVVLGWTGGTSSFKTYASGFCPFEDYNFPYVHAPVEIVTSSSASGRLVGITILYATGETTSGLITIPAQIKSLYMPIFDTNVTNDTNDKNGSKPMFSTALKSTEQKGSIRMTTTFLSKTLFTKSYETIHNNGVDIRNELTFENVSVVFAPPAPTVNATGGVSINLDFGRTRFPISPMLDVTFQACDVTINQQIMLMPGSTMTFDCNSVLILGYESTDATPFASGSSYISADSKRLAGGILALSYDLYGEQKSFNDSKNGLSFNGKDTYAGYWDVLGMASVNIYGTLEFQSGNYEEYVLSGNINVSFFRVDDGTTMAWTLANLTSENLRSTDATAQNVALRTYGSVTALGTMKDSVEVYHYYSLPMINNGIAYVVDAGTGGTPGGYVYNGAMSGTHDVEAGQFTKQQAIGDFAADGFTNYIIDAKPYGSSVSTNELPSSNIILEFEPVILGVTTELKAELVTASNGKTYVFYAGTYSPATVAADGTVTIDGKYYITGGATKTMTWNGSQWNAS